MLLAILLVFSAHCGFVITEDCNRCIDGIFLLVLLGVGYALFSSVIWPSLPLIVSDKTPGTAMGLAECFLNTGTTISPFVVGALADETEWRDGYGYVSVFFACVGAIGIGFGLATILID